MLETETHYGRNLLSLFLVVVFAAFDEWLTSLLQHDKIKRHCSTITIPILVGIIIFGCIVRNAFGGITEIYYNVE